ncbi:MAG: lysophospholipid acyltransferase family protein [Myxococcales bacterium]|nr:lysophospholipid acyltransferase family protein [Myxococcales bacterium]
MAKKRSWWKRTRRKIIAAVVPPIAAALLQLIYRTLRIEIINERVVDRQWGSGETAIHLFWHGRMLFFPPVYQGPGMAILISLHHDGEIIARTVHRLGFRTVRGSTTEGASAAAKQMVRFLREGVDIAITPDGPRGPRYVIPEGAIELARLSGRPIIPASAAASRCWTFSSWDHFVVPFPFARCVVYVGDPVTVPRRASPEVVSALREKIQGEMRLLTDAADAHFGARERAPSLSAEGP